MNRFMILKGKRALVTGGALRIGKALVEALKNAGVEVVVHYRNSANESKKLSPLCIQADLQNQEACSSLLKRVNDQFGSVDILINNASVFTRDSLAESTPSSVLNEFQINLFAPMELIRTFAAQTEQGTVLNLLDRRICSNDTSCTPYLLSKKGLAALTKLAALEYAPRITVNAIAPGPILPPPGSSLESVFELAGKIPLEQLPAIDHIADATLFILRAESITGQVIFVDGGQHLLGNGV
jgi:pteridine reductase